MSESLSSDTAFCKRGMFCDKTDHFHRMFQHPYDAYLPDEEFRSLECKKCSHIQTKHCWSDCIKQDRQKCSTCMIGYACGGWICRDCKFCYGQDYPEKIEKIKCSPCSIGYSCDKHHSQKNQKIK